MAMNTGARASYTDTYPNVRNVEDAIMLVSPLDVPLLKVIAGLQEAQAKPPRLDTLSQECVSTKYEWLEDTLSPHQDTLGSAVSDTTGTSWTVTDGTKFRAGHVLLVDTEEFWVSSVSSNTVYGTRGFAGSTPATHLISTTIDIIGIAMLEGADAPEARSTSTTNPYNYTQIFEVPITVTGTQAATKKIGIADEYKYQMGKAFRDICILVEKAVFNGKRSSGAGSASTARAMGGFPTFITGNVTSLSSAALTEKDINDLLASIFADVGSSQMARDIFVGQWLKRKISSFYNANARMDSKERVGGVFVDTIRTDFGDISVHGPGLYTPASKLIAVNLEYLGIGPLRTRGFAEKKLAVSGDYIKGEIVGEYVLELKNDNAHGMLTSVSTTS
jgi:hypothetical protein